MKRTEYQVYLTEAMTQAGLKGTCVYGDQMSAVAMHLPTEVLKAIIKKEVIYEDTAGGPHLELKGVVPFHHGWIQACDDELTDRILTDNIDEGKES